MDVADCYSDIYTYLPSGCSCFILCPLDRAQVLIHDRVQCHGKPVQKDTADFLSWKLQQPASTKYNAALTEAALCRSSKILSARAKRLG